MSFGFMHKHKIHHASSKGTSTTQGADGTGPGSGTGTTKKATAGTNGNLLYGGGGDLEKEKATERDNATVISNPGVDGIFSDKNGNMGEYDLKERLFYFDMVIWQGFSASSFAALSKFFPILEFFLSSINI